MTREKMTIMKTQLLELCKAAAGLSGAPIDGNTFCEWMFDNSYHVEVCKWGEKRHVVLAIEGESYEFEWAHHSEHGYDDFWRENIDLPGVIEVSEGDCEMRLYPVEPYQEMVTRYRRLKGES